MNFDAVDILHGHKTRRLSSADDIALASSLLSDFNATVELYPLHNDDYYVMVTVSDDFMRNMRTETVMENNGYKLVDSASGNGIAMYWFD